MEVSGSVWGCWSSSLSSVDRFLYPCVDLDPFLPACKFASLHANASTHHTSTGLNLHFQCVSMVYLASQGDCKRVQCLCKRIDWIFMDLQGIFMAFTGKVVPQAGKTEFRSACRRHGGAADPLIKETKNKTITNIYTPTPIYTHIRTHIHHHRYGYGK